MNELISEYFCPFPFLLEAGLSSRVFSAFYIKSEWLF